MHCRYVPAFECWRHCLQRPNTHIAIRLVLMTMPSASSLYCRYACRQAKAACSPAESSLQEEGLDTVDANRALGLPDDCREYSSVKNILKDLRIKSIRLMVRFASSLADSQGSACMPDSTDETREPRKPAPCIIRNLRQFEDASNHRKVAVEQVMLQHAAQSS